MKSTLTILTLLAVLAVVAMPAGRAFLGGCAEKAHAALFGYMARSGMVLGMAEFDARQITGLTSSPKTKVQPYDHGQINVLIATTPATAAWAQNDTFEIGTILKGSRILRSGKVYHGAFGSSVTMDVGMRKASDGTVVDVDGIAAALNVAAAGNKDLNGGSSLNGVTVASIVATEDWVLYATLAGANPTDDIQAEFEIHYLAPQRS